MDQPFDVAVVGAGVVGAAIARELSRYRLTCALLDALPDVGMGTSKASTAIWHTGFDATPGTLEARLVRRGFELLDRFMPDANVPFERTGGLLIAWTDEQLHNLPALLQKAHANGEADARIVPADEVYRREPHLGPGALGGMLVPREGILCTFSLPLAYATQAVLNGTTLRLNHRITGVHTGDGVHTLDSPAGPIRCRHLVNAAGLYSDAVDNLLGHRRFTVTPRRGELLVFDKLARPLVNHVLLPVPTAKTKGVLISPTVFGNVLLGPTAEDQPDKTAAHTSASGLHALLEKGRAILPDLLREEVTSTYAGLRAATEDSDYQIHAHPGQRYVCVGGIRSTGVSASLAIAEYVVELLGAAGLVLKAKSDFVPVRMPTLGEAGVRPYQSAAMIARNPAYGEIVCHCERVTRGEIDDALHATVPARTLDGLRRRTRVLQGRCQGFHCQGAVVRCLARATGESAARLLALEAAHD